MIHAGMLPSRLLLCVHGCLFLCSLAFKRSTEPVDQQVVRYSDTSSPSGTTTTFSSVTQILHSSPILPILDPHVLVHRASATLFDWLTSGLRYQVTKCYANKVVDECIQSWRVWEVNLRWLFNILPLKMWRRGRWGVWVSFLHQG